MNRITIFVGLCVAITAAAAAHAQGSAGFEHRIQWDVADSGGATMSSALHTLSDTLAQPTPPGWSLSNGYRLSAGFLAPPDGDHDGVRNFLDNCEELANPAQRDSNGDGFGNRCDADLNGDNIVNVVDLGRLKTVFFTGDADADLNGDGIVNVVDLGIMKAAFFLPPGPSGIH